MSSLPPSSLPDAAPPVAPGVVVRSARAATVAALLALIVLGLAWELWLAPTGSGTLALKVLPLMLCLGGLLRHRMYTFRWLSLLIWLYFMEGTVRAYAESGRGAALAWAEIALSLLVFGLSVVYIRWRQRQGELAAQAVA
ncbi:MAG: DUF2069 domain-containing protein [Leptothrix sp. (in: Bacteria)]|nr:DUF2069 domain-containing protein [Leptothrix sp. (in: b-proteobacteria)]